MCEGIRRAKGRGDTVVEGVGGRHRVVYWSKERHRLMMIQQQQQQQSQQKPLKGGLSLCATDSLNCGKALERERERAN